MNRRLSLSFALTMAVAPLAVPPLAANPANRPDGSAQRPLRVLILPADGGTEDGTRADYQPILNAVTRSSGLHFEVRVGQSYGAVVEGLTAGLADLAFLGPVTFLQARERNAAELLAVAVEDGESVYYAGIFVAAGSDMRTIDDLRGRSMAFGDVNSTSSFTYQVAMMLKADLDPAADLGRVLLSGSHANALQALQEGHVEAAGASFDSFEKAVHAGAIDPARVRLLVRSDPIPYPPLTMHPSLPDATKKRLREAFHNVHEAEGVTPEMIRGYGGRRVDRYDAEFNQEAFDGPAEILALVTDEIKGRMLRRAAER